MMSRIIAAFAIVLSIGDLLGRSRYLKTRYSTKNALVTALGPQNIVAMKYGTF